MLNSNDLFEFYTTSGHIRVARQTLRNGVLTLVTMLECGDMMLELGQLDLRLIVTLTDLLLRRQCQSCAER